MYFRRSLISIHAPLTGSDMFYVFCFQFQPISIHAPLTGSDHDLTIPINSVSTISIHAPLTGSDFRGSVTPTHTRHFNPRSPHRERRVRVVAIIKCRNFNPRSPHRERRHIVRYNSGVKIFQSTLPSQGATLFRAFDTRPPQISIHAPLTGSDNDCYAMYVSLSISIHAPLTRSDKWRKRNR